MLKKVLPVLSPLLSDSFFDSFCIFLLILVQNGLLYSVRSKKESLYMKRNPVDPMNRLIEECKTGRLRVRRTTDEREPLRASKRLAMNLKLKNAVCPQCGYLFDGATQTKMIHENTPRQGDKTVCIHCGTAVQFGLDGKWRQLSNDELLQIALDYPLTFARLVKLQNEIELPAGNLKKIRSLKIAGDSK